MLLPYFAAKLDRTVLDRSISVPRHWWDLGRIRILGRSCGLGWPGVEFAWIWNSRIRWKHPRLHFLLWEWRSTSSNSSACCRTDSWIEVQSLLSKGTLFLNIIYQSVHPNLLQCHKHFHQILRTFYVMCIEHVCES